MSRASDKLADFRGANPFREAQARAGSGAGILSEFYPTSTFWSLFNDQHEILLGTRGSGKTYLLRMMTYSLLRRLDHDSAREIIKNRSFIAFYLPLHLEFLASLPGRKLHDELRLGWFQFAFNCAAAKSLLTEVAAVVSDTFQDATERLLAEGKIIRLCTALWFGTEENDVTTISDLQFKLELKYATTPFWRDDTQEKPALPLARNILTPVVSVLPRLSEALNLEPDATKWVACIDEAEFLNSAFLRCINSCLRSEKRPVVVKLATLPFRHSTRETLTPNVSIQPRGHDYAYVTVDLPWDSSDFEGLTNHISTVRLRRTQRIEDGRLESFLGTVGEADELIDYFRAELSEEAESEETLLSNIVAAMSKARQQHYEQIKAHPEKVDRPYLHRFAPVYFARRMRIENQKGGRTAAWFAGAKMIRRIADGNPRRFIQLMSDLFEKARDERLTPKTQHRTITGFCERYLEDVEGYPECGPLLKAIVDSVGDLLSRRIHGDHMVDGGCNFKIDSQLLDVQIFRETIEFAIGYSIFMADKETVEGKLESDSDLRLSYVFAVSYWLPMRKGDPVFLRSAHADLPGVTPVEAKAHTSESRDFIDSFQLGLFESNNDHTASTR